MRSGPVGRISLSVLIGLFAVLVACSGDSSGSSPTSIPDLIPSTVLASPKPPEPSPTPSPVATATPSEIEDILDIGPSDRDPRHLAELLLRHVPDTEKAREGFWVSNYGLAAELHELATPDPDDPLAVEEFVFGTRPGSVIRSSYYLAGYIQSTEAVSERSKTREFIGFAQSDISHGIAIGTEDQAVEVVFGDIDPTTSHSLIEACTVCVDADEKSHLGVDFYSWGSDYGRSFDDRYAAPLFDSAGRGGRLAVGQSVAWRTLSDADMELAISTAAGESASLADASEFKDLLEFMLEESATSVFLSSETVGRNDPDDALIDALSPGFTVQAEAFGWTEEQQTELKDKIIPDNLPLPFDGYALGTVWNGFGFNTIIAYAYPSETAASDGYLSMERHFDNKRVQIDERLYRDAFGVSVTVEGRIIAVRLGRNVGYGLIDSLQEPIFIHE